MKRWLWAIGSGVGVLLVTFIVVLYFLPLPDGFLERTYARPTRIYDHTGRLLYEVVSSGRTAYIPLEEIPPLLVQATILLEDKGFYQHDGIDIGAVLRAVWSNAQYGRVVSGASTIPQQVVRNVLGTERKRTLQAKLYESLLALRVSHVYSKEEILEMYFNMVFYGNNAYGIAAASQTYFGKELSTLDLAELSLLVGLPQAPSRYNPMLYPDRAKKRQQEVLDVLLQAGHITEEERQHAMAQQVQYRVQKTSIHAPHFVHAVIEKIQERYGIDAVQFGGMDVVTSLDLGVYQDIQRIMQERIAQVREFRVSNAAVVVLDNKTGEVVSLNGSLDYFDTEIHGEVAMPFAYRQPGSTLKPFVYGLAFTQGDVPATPVVDIERRFFTEEGTPYLPKNYDNTFHGLVSIREALANSYNVPAVDMVHRLGIRPVVHLLKQAGIDMWGAESPEQLGLAVALGDGEVTLFALTNAYRMLANYGLFTDTKEVLTVNDVVYSNLSRQYTVFTPEVAYMLTHILADNGARMKQFGEENFLKLPFAVAAKTGTTRNYKDNWVLGYSPYYTVGVWVGNADGGAMQQVSGVTGAGPIFYDVMLRLHRNKVVRDFYVPPRMRTAEVCTVSGLLPTAACLERVQEIFPEDRVPTAYDTLWQPKDGGGTHIVYPQEVASWALAQGFPVQGGETNSARCLLRPHDLDRFRIVTDRPLEQQQIVFRACQDDVEWKLNNQTLGTGQEYSWELQRGTHVLQIRWNDQEETIRFAVE